VTTYYGELGMSAWPRAAIDVALWDLKAQAAGEPLYRLLGGDDPQIRAYASSMDARHDREELAGLHGEYADEGFTAFKTKVGGSSAAADAERVGEVRAAVWRRGSRRARCSTGPNGSAGCSKKAG